MAEFSSLSGVRCCQEGERRRETTAALRRHDYYTRPRLFFVPVKDSFFVIASVAAASSSCRGRGIVKRIKPLLNLAQTLHVPGLPEEDVKSLPTSPVRRTSGHVTREGTMALAWEGDAISEPCFPVLAGTELFRWCTRACAGIRTRLTIGIAVYVAVTLMHFTPSIPPVSTTPDPCERRRTMLCLGYENQESSRMDEQEEESANFQHCGRQLRTCLQE